MKESTRQLKYAKLIKKDLSEIFQIDKLGILAGSFVTIADVKVTPDLGIAKIYLSMLMVDDRESLIDRITSRKSEIRKALGLKIGKQVRIVPDLLFFIDEVEEKASKIDKLIDSLDIPPAEEE